MPIRDLDPDNDYAYDATNQSDPDPVINARVNPWSATCWSLEVYDGFQWRTLENYSTRRDAEAALAAFDRSSR